MEPQDYFGRHVNVVVDQEAMDDKQNYQWNTNITQIARTNFENNHLSLDGPPDCYNESVSLQLEGCTIRDM